MISLSQSFYEEGPYRWPTLVTYISNLFLKHCFIKSRIRQIKKRERSTYLPLKFIFNWLQKPRILEGTAGKPGQFYVHSVLERIWIKGSYLSQWLPQGEREPPKESKSPWIEIFHGGSYFTLWFLKIKNFQKFSDHSEIFFALQYTHSVL